MCAHRLAVAGFLLAAGSAAASPLAPVPTSYVDAWFEHPPAPAEGPLHLADQPLIRLTEPTYADGFNAPTQSARPSPRTVFNEIDQPDAARTDVTPMTNLGVVMMQLFVSHEIARSPTLPGPANAFDLPVPPDDPIAVQRDEEFLMPMQRSAAVGGTGPGDPRQQLNSETPAFDASIVYGSTPERTELLRRNDGSGELRTGPGNTLPLLIDGRPTAGDGRADENKLLEAAHTLFMRQHNRLAGQVRDACTAAGKTCDGDDVFGMSRRLLTAQTQKIAYEELLPAFLGTDDLTSLLPADLPPASRVENIKGAINEATTAVLRVGHSQVPNTIVTIDDAGARTEVDLASCFFSDCLAGASLADILRGAAHQPGNPVDASFATALRQSQLPGPFFTFVVDLPGTTTHRADDHGLGGFAALRAVLGLPDVPLEDLLPKSILDAYRDADGNLSGEIPIFPAIIGEEPVAGAQVGATAAVLHALQFAALRHHDPNFYDKPGVFDDEMLAWIYGTSLRQLIIDNTSIEPDMLPADVYITPIPGALPLAATAFGALFWLNRRRGRGRG